MIEINRTKKEELLDWLDAQIEFKEKTSKFSESIYNLSAICNERTIHVSDVEEIADIIGYDIHFGPYDETYYKEYLMYKGYEVFKLKSHDIKSHDKSHEEEDGDVE